MSGHLLSHSNSFSFEMEKDAAGCRAFNRNFIVGEFIHTLDTYMHWYNNNRIKKSLGGLSPLEYRISLGLID